MPPSGLTLEEVGYPPDDQLAARPQRAGCPRPRPPVRGGARVSEPSHYFDATPTGPERRRHVTVRVWGRELELSTANGVFAGDGLDRGTAVLLRASAPPTGSPPAARPRLRLGADRAGDRAALPRGAGRRRRRQRPGAGACAATTPRPSAWPTGSGRCGPSRSSPTARYDEIWSNPPIRIGKEALHALLLTLAAPAGPRRAWPGWWSAGTSAPTRCSAGWSSRATRCERVATAKGFRVLVVRPAATQG